MTIDNNLIPEDKPNSLTSISALICKHMNCPECQFKLKRNDIKKGLSKYGFVPIPFQCPNCGVNIIIHKRAHYCFWGSMILFSIVYVIHSILEHFWVSLDIENIFYLFEIIFLSIIIISSTVRKIIHYQKE